MLVPLLTPPARKWTPARIPALQSWYTAGPSWCFTDTGGTTPAGHGDTVAFWADRTTNARHFVQSTAGSRPTLRLESGKWLLRFDGGDSFTWNSTPTFSNAATGMAIACNPTATASDSQDLGRLRDSGVGDAAYIVRISSKMRGMYQTSTGAQTVNSDADFDDSPSSCQWVVNSGRAYIHRLNRAEKTGTLAGSFTSRTINLIQAGTGPIGTPWGGDIYEYIIGGGWDAATADAIDRYFSLNWGTP